MESLFLLIPLSLVTLGVAIVVFFRMSGTGQFEEGESPAWQVLLDDDRAAVPADGRQTIAERPPLIRIKRPPTRSSQHPPTRTRPRRRPRPPRRRRPSA